MFWQRRRQSDFKAEINAHLELEVERLKEQGLSEEDARMAARRGFGNLTQAEERFYESTRWLWLDHLMQDIRFGLRTLAKKPGFTSIAVSTLALGIGANTAIFSLMNAVMLRALPVQNPGQLVMLGEAHAGGSTDDFAATGIYSYPFYQALREKNQAFSGTSSMLSMPFNTMHGLVEGKSEMEALDVQLVSGSYFPMLGVRPVLGRTFTDAEDEPAGGHPVAMLSYSWWAHRFARDPAILGKTVTLGSTAYTIIGVAPEGFFGTSVGLAPNLWIPLSMEKQVSPGWNELDEASFQSLYILGRLKDGVSAEQAKANVNVLARQIWTDEAGGTLTAKQQAILQHTEVKLTPIKTGLPGLRRQATTPLEILMAVVGLVLLIVCANIANLQMARASARQREIAVRISLGAGRGRLIRQLLTESLLLALAGGAVGAAIAGLAGNALAAMLPHGSGPLPVDARPDARVLAFTFVVALGTALLCGMAPALRATRVSLGGSLREGRGRASAATRTPLAKALIISQVALSLLLLIGAGLFLRTLVNLFDVDTGFDKQNVLLFGIDPSAAGYVEDERLGRLYQQIEQRVGALPGVRAASIAFFTFNEGEWTDPVTVLGNTSTPEDKLDTEHNIVGQGFFAAMGIPLMLGRTFDARDNAASPKVAVVNETFVRQCLLGGSPIGQHFGIGADPKNSNDIEIIGVVKDAKHWSVRERPYPAAYYPYIQRAHVQYFNDFVVRYNGNAGVIISEVRQAIGQVDRALPVAYTGTLAESVDRSLASQSLVARLSTFFAALAAFLACIGIYGLTSYSVARRTNEIGIRLALGADRAGVLWMVMRESLGLAAIGVAIGIPAAIAAGRSIASVLYGLKSSDPVTLLVAAVVMTAVAALASYFPARCAAEVDPMVALRNE